jgi:hypothetical protein
MVLLDSRIAALAFISILAFSAICVGSFVKSGKGVSGLPPILLEDDFESYTAGAFPSNGWNLAFNGAGAVYQVVVDDVATSPVQSLQLVGSPGWAADAVKPFYSDAAVIGFEVSVRVAATSGLVEDDARVGFWRREAPNIAEWYATVGFRGDGIIHAGGLDLQPFLTGVWYKVTVTYDREANLYSVWIDDVLRGENLAGPTHSSPYSIEAFALSGRYTGERTTYDDVAIFGEGYVPPPPSTLPVEDDFEGYNVGTFPTSGGWDLVYEGNGSEYQKVVDTVSMSPTKSFQLIGSPGWAADAALDISAEAQIVGFEVYVMVDEFGVNDGANGRCGFYVRQESSGLWPWRTYVQFLNNGSIATGASGSGSCILQPYELDQWYKVKLVFNRSANSYSVWIDDVLKAQGLRGPSDLYDPYYIEAFTLSSSMYNSVAVYFDDVAIFEEGGPPPPPPPPPSGTNVHVDPESVVVGVDQEFTVKIEVTAVENLYGLDIKLEWDPQFLACVSHTVLIPVENSTNGILHEPVIMLKDSVNQTAGTCWIAYASMYPASAFSGNGTVFEVTFRAKTLGACSIDIVSSDLADIDGQPITHSSISGTVQITIPGDVDGDNDVDIFDVVRISSRYGCTSEDPQFDPACDVDCDCDIDIFDIVIAAGNYGTKL